MLATRTLTVKCNRIFIWKQKSSFVLVARCWQTKWPKRISIMWKHLSLYGKSYPSNLDKNKSHKNIYYKIIFRDATLYQFLMISVMLQHFWLSGYFHTNDMLSTVGWLIQDLPANEYYPSTLLVLYPFQRGREIRFYFRFFQLDPSHD